MDGNRRWAKEHFLPSAAGHKKGVESLRNVIKACIDNKIKYLTVYAFSTENWKRSKDEVNFLMSLVASTISAEIPEFKKNDVKVRFIGDKNLPNKNLSGLLENCENETKDHKTLNLQIAFNYGARAEITKAFKAIYKQIREGKLTIEDVTEETVSNNLYTKNIPDPDLLIRTGGEKRISNYLLWQAAYSEIYVTDKYWPEFGEKELTEAINEFTSRIRRFGK